jgi:hypothetical protein
MKVPAWLVTIFLNFIYEKGRDLITELVRYLQDQKKISEEKKKMAIAVAEYKAALKSSRDERRQRAKDVLNSDSSPKP